MANTNTVGLKKINAAEGRFMVAVGAIIEHVPSGEILLLKRAQDNDFAAGIWEEITGRMKQFEEVDIALKREVMEETGLKIKLIKPISTFHFFRGEKNAANEVVGIIYWCQTISKKVVISSEHETYAWLKPEQALKVVNHPGVKRDIELFLQEKI